MTERDVSAVRVEQTGDSIGAGTDVTQHSVGELVKEVTQDLTKLMGQELALAKLEMSNEAKKAGKTAGAYAGAGVAGNGVREFPAGCGGRAGEAVGTRGVVAAWVLGAAAVAGPGQ